MSYKILLIEDSVTQLETLKRLFLDADFEVETAKDGEEGYKKVFSSAPDVILSDIIMPNLNGYQFCRLLKNNSLLKDIPVVLLTVLDSKLDKFWGNKSGADKFVSKTVGFDELKQIIKETIKNNPISNEYKTNLIRTKVNGDALQNQITTALDDLLMSSTFVNEFRKLNEYLSHEKVLVEKTFELLRSFIEYNLAGIFFNSPDKNEKCILHLDINKNPVSSFVFERIKRDFFSSLPNLKNFTIRDFGHDIVKEDYSKNEKIVTIEDFESFRIIPVFSENKLLGGICLYNKEPFDYENFVFFETVYNEIMLLMKMRYLYSEIEYLSVTDGLTCLYNRRLFDKNMEREFSRAKRYEGDLTLAILDIDFFKKVNDTYGHQFGDYVLREISTILSDSFRKTDMIYRYGGEELTVIFSDTTMENAMVPLQRLKQKVAEHKFVYNDAEANITISIGVCTNASAIENKEALVELADKALYKAKQNGRNKVVAYLNEQFSEVLQ